METIIYVLVGIIALIGVYGMYKFVEVYTMGYKDDKDEWLVMPHQGPTKLTFEQEFPVYKYKHGDPLVIDDSELANNPRK